MKKSIKTIFNLLFVAFFTVNAQAQKPSPDLLDPTNHMLVLIDHEGQMSFAVKNIPGDQLRNSPEAASGSFGRPDGR